MYTWKIFYDFQSTPFLWLSVKCYLWYIFYMQSRNWYYFKRNVWFQILSNCVCVRFKLLKKCSHLWDVTIKKALSWENSRFHKDNLTLSRKRNSNIIYVGIIYIFKKFLLCSNTPCMRAGCWPVGAAPILMYLLPLPQLYTASKYSLLWSLAVSNTGP